jgi:hypothetical protein
VSSAKTGKTLTRIEHAKTSAAILTNTFLDINTPH